MTRLRCAIYTRKSTEEGLTQDFNSLDAQRAACLAYVASQASEGWVLVPTSYDDGGISGGTMERPGLKALLSDIAASRIDIVVVYKVDRLTRSLLDFAKLVELFDKARVSFVSITQSFNTTTSMGRLTLNMLLSFAQFEREVTAERIRDKIAASKQRGMWMGGNPPLGYTPQNRKLVAVEHEAALVRHLFQRYLELACVRLLLDELTAQGIEVPERCSSKGKVRPARPFTRSELFWLLRSPVYDGRIQHHALTYPGQHERLIDKDLWDAVQSQLATNTQGERPDRNIRHASPFSGRVHDPDGQLLIASHACKGKRRYRYYISRPMDVRPADGKPAKAMRVPALELERLVACAIADRLADPSQLLRDNGQEAAMLALDEGTLDQARTIASELRAGRLGQATRGRPALLQTAIARCVVHPDHITIEARLAPLLAAIGIEALDDARPIQITIPARVRRSGSAVRIIDEAGALAAPSAQSSATILAAIARAQQWWDELSADPSLNARRLAERDGIDPGYLGRVLRLAFLDPKLVERFVKGTAPASITLHHLLREDIVQPDWAAQRQKLVAPASRV